MLGSQRLQGDRTQDVMRQDTTEEIRSCLANGTVLADAGSGGLPSRREQRVVV